MRDLDAEILAGLEEQLARLDREHARATSPKQRRRIEAKMRRLREEHAKIVVAGKRVDDLTRAAIGIANDSARTVIGVDPGLGPDATSYAHVRRGPDGVDRVERVLTVVPSKK